MSVIMLIYFFRIKKSSENLNHCGVMIRFFIVIIINISLSVFFLLSFYQRFYCRKKKTSNQISIFILKLVQND